MRIDQIDAQITEAEEAFANAKQQLLISVKDMIALRAARTSIRLMEDRLAELHDVRRLILSCGPASDYAAQKNLMNVVPAE